MRILKGARCQAGSMKTTWIGSVLDGAEDGMVVTLRGWVRRTRGNNNLRFIVLRDSTGSLQCVVKRDVVGDEAFEAAKGALIEASVVIEGTARADPRAPGGYELSATQFEVVGGVDPERPFPITESAMSAAEGGETNSSSITGTCTSEPSE